MARGIAATWLLLSVALCQAIVLPEASHPGRTTPAARSPQTRSLRIVRSYKPRSNRPAGREVGRNGFATSKFRQGYLLDVKPLEVLVSLEGPVQCLVACLFRFPRCKAFNFGNRTCKLLESFLCDPAMPDVRLQRDEMSRYYDVMTSQEIRVSATPCRDCFYRRFERCRLFSSHIILEICALVEKAEKQRCQPGLVNVPHRTIVYAGAAVMSSG